MTTTSAFRAWCRSRSWAARSEPGRSREADAAVTDRRKVLRFMGIAQTRVYFHQVLNERSS